MCQSASECPISNLYFEILDPVLGTKPWKYKKRWNQTTGSSMAGKAIIKQSIYVFGKDNSEAQSNSRGLFVQYKIHNIKSTALTCVKCVAIWWSTFGSVPQQ